MEQISIFARGLQFWRLSKAPCLLVSAACCFPFIIFGLGSYLGYPDGRTRSWFDPFEVPLALIAVLCCITVPFLVSGSLWRRFFLLVLALGALGVATLLAVLLSVMAFGLPIS